MNCDICGEERDEVDDNNPLCDGCWYGMRMCPDEWKARMEAKGIEIERGMGCQPMIPGGFICGDPYKRKKS